MGIEIIGGAVFAALVIYYKRQVTAKELHFWAWALVLAALVYVGFASWAKDWTWLPTELLGVFLYGIAAYLGWRYSPGWLALGWLAHIAWDIGLHAGGTPGFVPHWYPGVCIGFDVCVAIYLAMRYFTNVLPKSSQH